MPGICDVSGTWVIDKSRSDTLDEFLSLMGLPWIARKLAGSLEVTAMTKHDVAAGSIVTEDHSSMGITVTTYTLDGQSRSVTRDGKTSVMTSTLLTVPPPPRLGSGEAWAPPSDPLLSQAYGAFRVHSVLPHGGGETTDTRIMIEEGRTMKQNLLYVTAAGKRCVVSRYMVNKDYSRDKFAASVAAMHPPAATSTAGGGAAAAAAAAASTPAAAATPAVVPPKAVGATPAASTPASSPGGGGGRASTTAATPGGGGAAAAGGLDPFFVSMSGMWTVDAARSVSLDELWSSLGVGWLARKIIGAFDSTTTITHSQAAFKTEDRSGLGSFAHTWRVGKWDVVRQADGRYMVVTASQPVGAGDGGTQWLGDIGRVPAAWLDERGGGSGSSSGSSSSDEEAGGGRAAAGELTGDAAARGTRLRDLPVNAAAVATAEVVLTVALADVTGKKDALAHVRALADEVEEAATAAGRTLPRSDDPLAPPPATPVLRTTYRMNHRDEVSVVYQHLDGTGRELVRAHRTLVRKETSEARAVALVAESARLQHACTLLNARRAAADSLKDEYYARRARLRAERDATAARIAAAAAARAAGAGNGGGSGSGGAAPAPATAAAAKDLPREATHSVVRGQHVSRDVDARHTPLSHRHSPPFAQSFSHSGAGGDEDDLTDGVGCVIQ